MAWNSNKFNDLTSLNSMRGKTVPVQVATSQMATGGQQQQNHSSAAMSKLESLHIGSLANVIGIVIGKDEARLILTRKGTEKFLFSFVLRDSPTAFVNCTVWGSEDYIKGTARSFCIGDVVKLENVQVQSNAPDGFDEKFRVTSPLGFHLSLGEKHSKVSQYDGLDMGSYAHLLYIPTKPSSDYYTLEDVLANGQNLNGEHINLLAAVRKIGLVRDITTKAGKHTKRCEIKLFDESCPSFALVVWGEELADFVLTWTPLETVLFIADVRMNYDDFRSTMVATADRKTIFTANPETADAQGLFQFAQTQNFSLEDDQSVDQIKELVVTEQISPGSVTTLEYVQLYGVITKLDLDADNVDHFFRRKCSKCKQLVTTENGYQCTNQNCTQGALAMFNTSGQISMEEPELDFSIPITISDHTGSISTRLTDPLLESLTGFKGKDLMLLPMDQRTHLKWNFLMERCKFYLKVVKNIHQPEKHFFRVLACSRADTEEMVHNISR